MSIALFKESLSTVTMPEELIKSAMQLLHTPADELNEECEMLFAQKMREVTINSNVTPMTIMMKVLTQFNREIVALCECHEAMVYPRAGIFDERLHPILESRYLN